MATPARILALAAVLLCLHCACVSAGSGLQARRKRTPTLAQDEALAWQAASVEGLQAAAAAGANAAPDAAATAAAAAPAAVAAPPACASPQFEWPAGTGYCWYKRDTGTAKQGPGPNIFKSSNVAVNAAGQLVLTILYPKNPGSCAEVFANRSMGYGDYIVVTETNATAIDRRLVASPFIYADDTREYDMEYSLWSDATAGANNSQFVVQPYTINTPRRFRVNTMRVTHRIRWTPAAVSFESWLPDASGGALLSAWTYVGPNNFEPGTYNDRMRFNFWISVKASDLPASSTFVLNCFKFCAQANLAACSTALGTKPRCSATQSW